VSGSPLHGCRPRAQGDRTERDNDKVKYVTHHERFILGDFPMVCARSGLPATELVPVQAQRASLWPWLFFPGLAFLLASWVTDRDRPWGLLPFAEGHVRGVSATYERGIGVILKGVHPEFVRATRHAQGKDD